MSSKKSKTIGATIEETRKYHEQYSRATSHPVRRKILRAIKEGYKTIKELHSRTGLDVNILDWHLSVLEQGFCIERDSRDGKIVYKLTQEGRVINHLE
jgi:DNA-binding transcriptional ArsR family regulator